MFFLPLYHNLNGIPCLVVGAGTTAERKLRWLLRAGAQVTVISPEVSDSIKRRHERGELVLEQRMFSPQDAHPRLRLIVSATNNRAVNTAVFAAAQAADVMVNCVDQPDLCTFIFPAIVDRAPILVAVSSMGNAPTLARVVRGWIEQLLPPKLGTLALFAKTMRDEVKQGLPSVDGRMRFWEALFKGPVAAKVMDGDTAGARSSALTLLSKQAPATGQVALVGAGPGDPELITLKALRLIQGADVILYDKLANPALLDYARRDAECIYVGKQGPKPGDNPKRANNRSNQQGDINDSLVNFALNGKNVVRLKGGDPFIYGRGGEELESALAARVDIIVVPGITAAMGAASYAGIPLTYRNLSQSVRFVTGHRIENTINLDWPELGRPEQTLVIYMGLVGLPKILQSMVNHGCESERPAVIIEHATLPEQRVIYGTVADLAAKAEAAKITGPSIVIIGEVVALADGYESPI